MCKYSSTSELGFQRILDRLRDYVNRAQEKIAAASAQRQLQETATDAEREIGTLNG